MNLRVANMTMAGKLGVIAVAMLAFGYALGPIYNAICEMTGINILALGERNNTGVDVDKVVNTQIDRSRSITVEFDANSRGPWEFKPAQRSMQVHPGEMVTVMYEFQNVQNRRMAAQAIPSYAPLQAGAHFNKLQCFCFNQYTLEPGEKKSWPVVFVIDPKLSRDVATITLSYTFFEVGGTVPAAPQPTAAAPQEDSSKVRL
ncbi:MAG: cytochrome c oxidase assembly protein [Rhodoferax sp.]|jgi:cytochrome c oxidase assembly protein subunit 11|nr:cytochrome c oxidase assembly protein [Rhodoferax sp.]